MKALGQSKTNPLVVMAAVVVLSLIAAAVLFGLLDSTGAVESKGVKFGGAAAGFFATFVLLQRWYPRLAGTSDENEELRRKLEQQAELPDFKVPEHFLPFRAPEQAIAFCYPQAWRHEPQRVDLIFVEAPERMRAGDQFRGNMNVMVQPDSQRQLALEDVYDLARAKGVDDETIARKLGVQLSPETRTMAVDLARTLDLLGIEGDDFAERLYELDIFLVDQAMDAQTVRNEKTYIDSRPSRFVERSFVLNDTQLVHFQAVTYVPEAAATYAFTFTDNPEDRDKLEEATRAVLDTVRFWPQN